MEMPQRDQGGQPCRYRCRVLLLLALLWDSCFAYRILRISLRGHGRCCAGPSTSITSAYASLQDCNDSALNSVDTSSSRRKVLGGIARIPAALAVLGVFSQTCNALSPEEAATKYDSYAATYNDLDGGQAASSLGIETARERLISQAKGDVLEIGVGTGLNLDKYVGGSLTSLTFVDISNAMLKEAETRLANTRNLQGIPVKFIQADATSDLVKLFDKQAFDTVIDTFSLCVFGNEGARKSLVQMRDVVRQEGRVLLLENSRSTNPLLGLYQDATANAAAAVGGKGCLYNQEVGRLIEEAGMVVMKEEDYAAGLFRSYVCSSQGK